MSDSTEIAKETGAKIRIAAQRISECFAAKDRAAMRRAREIAAERRGSREGKLYVAAQRTGAYFAAWHQGD